MRLHPSAQSFDRVTEQYERGRPDYAKEAVDQVFVSLQVGRSSVVVDLGAGTGKLTRMLTLSGARVIAVEPLDGMTTVLRKRVPEAEILEGTAQAIPLLDGYADVVTAGSAFHWFAERATLEEIRRILKPGGGLALLWNRRDTTQPMQSAIGRIIQPYRGSAPSQATGDWKRLLESSIWFDPVGEWQFAHEQETDRTRVVDRVLSISFIADLPEEEREKVRDQVEQAAADMPEHFSLRYITDLYCYRSLSSAL